MYLEEYEVIAAGSFVIESGDELALFEVPSECLLLTLEGILNKNGGTNIPVSIIHNLDNGDLAATLRGIADQLEGK